jgi:Fe2+ or Zn2+ uptake regulation protein
MKMRSVIKKRWTLQREVLFRLIKEEGHIDADELYRKAKAVYPKIGLATVYRNLRLFRDLGLIKEVKFDEPHSHYEFLKGSEHHHFVCRKCGALIEFDASLLESFKEKLEERYGLKVEGMDVQVKGLCNSCGGEKDEA